MFEQEPVVGAVALNGLIFDLLSSLSSRRATEDAED